MDNKNRARKQPWIDIILFVVTALLAILYKRFGVEYEQAHFNLFFTLIYRVFDLPILLFVLGRIVARFIFIKCKPVLLKQNVYTGICALIWGLHLISMIGIWKFNWNHHIALGITCPWLFFAAGLGKAVNLNKIERR